MLDPTLLSWIQIVEGEGCVEDYCGFFFFFLSCGSKEEKKSYASNSDL